MISSQYRGKITQENIEEINEIIKKTELSLQQVIDSNNNKLKVILLGNTGSAKTTISRSLSNYDLKIQKGTGGTMVLIGEGIQPGGQSMTREPSIIIDNNSNTLFCDCPGFNDTSGFMQEIINSFSMKCLLEKRPNQINKIKILLVSSFAEIEANRGQGILNSILRVEEMFLNHTQLKENIGLVITKCKRNTKPIDYIHILEENAPEKLSEWCNFFKENIDHVFLFPKPSRKDDQKKYDFPDHQRLLEFMNTNVMVDPQHRISLGETSLLEMKNIRNFHLRNVTESVMVLCSKIKMQFQQEKTSDEFDKWINIMHSLLMKDIKNAKEFEEVVKEFIPNCEEYENDFQKMAEFEIFDAFIDKILDVDEEMSCLNVVISTWIKENLLELDKSYSQALKSEHQQKEIEQNQVLIKEKEEMNRKYQEKIEEMKNVLAQKSSNLDSLDQKIGQLYQIVRQQMLAIEAQRNEQNKAFFGQICVFFGELIKHFNK